MDANVSSTSDLNNVSPSEERSKKNRILLKTKFDSLPDDILRQILIRIPAQDLFDSTMYVCKNWYGMINTNDFRHAHLHRSTPGLLIKNIHNRSVTYMTVRQHRKIVVSKPSYDFRRPFWSSCNGLILEDIHDDNKTLTITNPVTKQHFALPPFFVPMGLVRCAIAYAAATMRYKVIRTSYLDLKKPKLGHYCVVLTVGEDTSWRLVDTQHLSVEATNLFFCDPFVTEGFVHWSHISCTFMLSMNVETEIITQIQIPKPECYLPRGLLHYDFSVGRSSSVSVLITVAYCKWEVWEMKPETVEWTRMPGIDIVALKSAFNQFCYEHDGSFKPDDRLQDWKLYPVGWLKYPEVIIFMFCTPNGHYTPCQSRFRAVYNVRTHHTRLFDGLETNYYPYLVHTNSLVRI